MALALVNFVASLMVPCFRARPSLSRVPNLEARSPEVCAISPAPSCGGGFSDPFQNPEPAGPPGTGEASSFHMSVCPA